MEEKRLCLSCITGCIWIDSRISIYLLFKKNPKLFRLKFFSHSFIQITGQIDRLVQTSQCFII